MESKINFEEVSFGIIGKVGEAKALAMEAFELGKNDKFTEANKKIGEAEELINEAGKLHMDVVVEEANGVEHKFSVIFMHAEDQFLSIQTFVLTTKMMIQIMEK